MSEEFSEKATLFLNALTALCIEHGVQLAVSDYDSLQIWDLEPNDDPVYASGIKDLTSSGKP